MARPSAAEMIAYQASQIGNNGRPYTNQYGWADNTPWCALFQSHCSDHFGDKLFNASAGVSGIVGQLSRIDDREASAGDIVAFNWDGRSDLGWMDHIGMVEWSDIDNSYNGNFGTIEGNTGSNSNLTSKVMRVTRSNSAGYFTAFFRPSYGAGNIERGASTRIWTPNDTDAQKWWIHWVDKANGICRIQNVSSGLFLDVANAGKQPGTAVRVWTGNDTDAQLWRILPVSGNYYPEQARPVAIAPMGNQALRLDIVNGGKTAGTGTQLWTLNHSLAQMFAILDLGNGMWIFSELGSGGLVLDVRNGGN